MAYLKGSKQVTGMAGDLVVEMVSQKASMMVVQKDLYWDLRMAGVKVGYSASKSKQKLGGR